MYNTESILLTLFEGGALAVHDVVQQMNEKSIKNFLLFIGKTMEKTINCDNENAQYRQLSRKNDVFGI